MNTDNLDEWPNCVTPDCQYKVCTWASDTHCFQCTKRLYGMEYMILMYNITHKHPWHESLDSN